MYMNFINHVFQIQCGRQQENKQRKTDKNIILDSPRILAEIKKLRAKEVFREVILNWALKIDEMVVRQRQKSLYVVELLPQILYGKYYFYHPQFFHLVYTGDIEIKCKMQGENSRVLWV